MRIGHHSEGLDARGRPVNHGGMAGEVWADFPGRCGGSRCHPDLHAKPHGENGCQATGTHFVCHAPCECPWPEDNGLSEAADSARRLLARDPAVHAVDIRQSIQPFEGTSWQMGPHVTTITRDDA